MIIVQTNINYTYEKMMQDIYMLKRSYPFLQLQFVGYSVLGRRIPVIKLGNGEKQVFYSGSYHGNEWITSTLLMKFIEDYCSAYTNNASLFGYNIPNIFQSTSIYIMPMVNPDGVDLVTGYFSTNSSIYKNFRYIANKYPSIPFPSGWKANFNGVNFINFHFFY